ncbi:MAG TPA: hypothetical protein PLT68_12400 [Actinomycetota bacterium]|nr:hypothetical protein [Actinomycetota bacterium]
MRCPVVEAMQGKGVLADSARWSPSTVFSRTTTVLNLLDVEAETDKRGTVGVARRVVARACGV